MRSRRRRASNALDGGAATMLGDEIVKPPTNAAASTPTPTTDETETEEEEGAEAVNCKGSNSPIISSNRNAAPIAASLVLYHKYINKENSYSKLFVIFNLQNNKIYRNEI